MALNVELQPLESLPVTKIGCGLMLKELATIFGLDLIPKALGWFAVSFMEPMPLVLRLGGEWCGYQMGL